MFECGFLWSRNVYLYSNKINIHWSLVSWFNATDWIQDHKTIYWFSRDCLMYPDKCFRRKLGHKVLNCELPWPVRKLLSPRSMGLLCVCLLSRCPRWYLIVIDGLLWVEIRSIQTFSHDKSFNVDQLPVINSQCQACPFRITYSMRVGDIWFNLQKYHNIVNYCSSGTKSFPYVSFPYYKLRL